MKMQRSLSLSIKCYVGMVAVLAVLLAVMRVLHVEVAIPVSQRALLTPPALLVIALLGLVGTCLLEKTGFPGIWDAQISIRHKLFIPLLLGVAFGIGFITIGFLEFLPNPEEPPFPLSLAYWVYGGVVSEIVFRLFPIPFLVWLISTLLLRGRAQGPVTWVAGVLSSLLEPLSQVGGMLLLGIDSGPGIVVPFVLNLSANLVLARLFAKYGLGASIAMRLAFYLIWHGIL